LLPRAVDILDDEERVDLSLLHFPSVRGTAPR
jgi:hypothetical protein